MSYDLKKVDAFVKKVADLSKRNPGCGIMLRFVTLIDQNSRSEIVELDQLVTEFRALSPWEQGNAMYSLAPMAERAVMKAASYYWGVARMEDKLELLGEADRQGAPAGAGT